MTAAKRQRLDPHQPHVDLAGFGVDANREYRSGLAAQADRRVERIGVTYRVDRHIDAALSGGAANLLTRVLLHEMERVRAEAPRDLQPVRDGVDREHRSRAGRDRDLDRAEADGAKPQHGDAVTG